MTQSVESMIEVQRKQIEALTAQVGVLKEALVISVPMAFVAAIQNMEIEDEDAEEINAIGSALAEEIPDDDRTVKETLFFLTSALATTPESALSEVRKAEREKCAVLCEQSDRYRGDYFAAKIRAMGDE